MQPWPLDIKKVSGEEPSKLRRMSAWYMQSTISVHEFAKQADPAVRIIVELGGEHPFFEQGLLLRGAIGVDLHEGAPGCESFDFSERGDAFAAIEVVHGIERYHRLETPVRERQLHGIA